MSRLIVSSLISSLPSIGWIVVLMSLIFYVFAVMATALFGDAFPDWFGDLGKSLFTLFQVMTLESWSLGIARPVMDVYPYAFLFFMPFVLISAFVILNFFVAINVNGMTDAKEDDDAQKEAQKLKEAKENQASNEDLKAELKLLKEHIAKIEAMLDSQNNDKTK
ncbi:MAG: ion transporter [Succinivibrionaceae bacterium]|nr:ion transporter [Succinivibrionaceae bacterium]